VGGQTDTGGFMKQVIVFDNNGRTADRYTIITIAGDVFNASENPQHPQGVGMFCGNIRTDWRRNVGQYVNEARQDKEWLGIEVKADDLPLPVKRFIAARV